MEYTVQKNGFSGMSAVGTMLASYNQLVELFGRSGNRHWLIKMKGHRFAVWLHGVDMKNKDEILPWSIAGVGNGYEVHNCRKVTGLPCFTPPDYYQLRQTYGWQSLEPAFTVLNKLEYGEQLTEIYAPQNQTA